MRQLLLWIATSIFAATAVFAATETAPAKVERLDPAINQIIPSDASLQKIATGFKWVEGPLWMPEGYLLFAEIPSDSIRKVVPGGDVTIFLQPSGYKGAPPFSGPEPGSNGLTLDARGRITVAGHAARDIYRFESSDPHGKITILADAYEGKKLNSPNDLVYRSDGSLYFTDPPYGLPTQSDSDPKKELKVNGVYRLSGALTHKPGAQPDPSRLQLLIADLPRPNGIAFSPDEKYLYVDNTAPQKIWKRYRVKADGTLADGVIFCDATSDKGRGSPDGMKVDEKGNIYSAGPGGIWIFSAEGKHLGTIEMPEITSNVAWGGADDKTLFITASHSVYSIRLKIRGISPRVK